MKLTSSNQPTTSQQASVIDTNSTEDFFLPEDIFGDGKRYMFARIVKGARILIIGGQIFIYSCSELLISFEINCFYSM